MNDDQALAPLDDPADPIEATAAREAEKIQAPPNMGVRQAAMMCRCVVYAIAGLKQREIAERTGLAYGSVRNYLSEARKYGIYKPEDTDRQLLDRIKTRSLEVIDELLDDDDKNVRGKYALEGAKGTGMLVQHQKQDVRGLPGGGAGALDFTLNLTITEPKRIVKDGDIIAGEVVGIPRRLDAPTTAPDD